MIRRLLRPVKRLLFPTSWALMYHHVSERTIDPWDLRVTPALFERQVLWLKKNRKISSLGSMVEDRASGQLQKHSIALTFDDGYLNNYELALPILEKYEAPACFFIPTRNVFSSEAFWWDEIESLILRTPELPRHFSLQVGDDDITCGLLEEAVLNDALLRHLQQWHYPQSPISKRALLYRKIHESMLHLSYDHQKRVIMNIAEWAGVSEISGTPEIMSTGIIKKLSEHPLITLGAHTVTHPALGKLGAEQQVDELAQGKAALEKLVGKNIGLIAYPYGSYDGGTPGLAERCGFKAGFTTQTIPFESAESPFMTGRIQVSNDMKFVREV